MTIRTVLEFTAILAVSVVFSSIITFFVDPPLSILIIFIGGVFIGYFGAAFFDWLRDA